MPTPNDPRMATLFVLVVASLMGGLFWLGLSRSLVPGAATSRRDALLLLAFGYFWVLVLLVNAAAAGSVGRRWAAISTLPTLDSLGAVEAAANGSLVLLSGHAGPRLGSADPSLAYVIEYDLEGVRVPGESGELDVALVGGAQRVTGLASVWNWRYERGRRARHWLAAGEPIVVLGTIRHGTAIGSGDPSGRRIWVEASLVYRGTSADFVAAAEQQRRRLWPRILAWASLAAAAVVGLLPLVRWLRRSTL
jgi:hypothetical protein